MGCCCSRSNSTTSERPKKGSYELVKDGTIVEPSRKHDDGGEVMNAIISELWPDMAFATLQKMKKKVYIIRPYEMHIVGGRIGPPPHITNVKFITGDEGMPVTYTCDVHYRGRPELEFALKGLEGKFISHFLPSVNVDLHWLQLNASVHVELSMKSHYCKFYFLEKPDVEWNLDVEVTKLDIPIHVEDMLDTRLEREFEKINENKPYHVNFGVNVKYQTKLGKSPKGRDEGWNQAESFNIGREETPQQDLSRPVVNHSEGRSTVRVELMQAEHLSAKLAADRNGLADPYAIAELRYAASGHRLKKHRTTRTKMISDTLDPVWDHSHEWAAIDEDVQELMMYVKVWDGDFLTSDPLGGVKIPITAEFQDSRVAAWYPLEKFGTKMKEDPTGRIQIRLMWCSEKLDTTKSESETKTIDVSGKWHNYSSDMNISEDGQTIKKIGGNEERDLATYGKPMATGKHSINLKLKSKSDQSALFAGVFRDGLPSKGEYKAQSDKRAWSMDTWKGGLFGNGHYYTHCAGTLFSDREEGVTSTSLRMELDLDNGTLKYFLHDKQHGPGFQGISGPVNFGVMFFELDQEAEVLIGGIGI